MIKALNYKRSWHIGYCINIQNVALMMSHVKKKRRRKISCTFSKLIIIFLKHCLCHCLTEETSTQKAINKIVCSSIHVFNKINQIL